MREENVVINPDRFVDLLMPDHSRQRCRGWLKRTGVPQMCMACVTGQHEICSSDFCTCIHHGVIPMQKVAIHAK